MRGASPKNPREARFVGTGNAWVDGRRMWELTCSKCPAKLALNGAGKHSSQPPVAIIKRFSHKGWIVGAKPKDDVCPICQRKPIAAAMNTARNALACMGAPTIVGDQRRITFDELLAAARVLDAEQAKFLIKVLRERLPLPAHREKPKPAELDPDYETWLNQ